MSLGQPQNIQQTTASPSVAAAQFKLNAKQVEALRLMTDRKSRHTLLLGGARSGKTFLIVRSIIIRCFTYPRSRHLSLRFHRTTAEKYLWKQTLRDVIDKCFPDVGFVQNNSRLVLTCPNGSTYWFGGLDEGDKGEGLLGSDWNTMHFDEISEMPMPMVMQARTRLSLKTLSADRKRECINRTFATINPTFKTSPIYKTYIEKFDVEKNMPMPPEVAELYNWYRINPADNIENLSADFLQDLESQSEANKRRFLYGEWSEESKDALFKMSDINRARVPTMQEAKSIRFDKVVIGVDPAVSSGAKADMTGIVVVGWVRPPYSDRRSSGSYYLLDDRSLRGTPDEWAQAVYDAYTYWKADLIVGERNNGGDLVEKNIRSVSRVVPFKSVWASRGKAIRAQPVVSLCEHGDLHVVACLPDLEMEMTTWNPESGEPSPNRLDAMVWGVTECMGGSFKEARIWGCV